MIKVLEQSTIDKIAAGEVIERPLSIVKELVENSVDAGAAKITIEIKDGGISMIRVTDNGCGIEKDEVRKAYMAHATSKLETADDLIGIGTLGFRGEALSTIAAVTETEMITKTRDSMTGVKYVINGGKEEELTEIGAPDGTTIIARNIFYNTPARLKFLKTSMTEGAYISDLVNHMALSHPEISFRLISNGRNLISTTGDGRLKETIYALYGSDITKSLLPVDYTYESIHITGFIGKPFLSKGNRSFENYFVNKRYIKSQVINKAIEEAYKTYVMQHRFPFTVLFLEVNPTSCDVNIHPAKLEFRYDNEKQLFHAVFHAVRDTLQQNELIPDAEADYGQTQKIYKPIPESARMPQRETVSKPETEPVQNLRSEMKPEPIQNLRTETKQEPIQNLRTETKHQPVSVPKADSSLKGKSHMDGYSILESILPGDYRERLKDTIYEKQPEEKSFVQESTYKYLSPEALNKHKIIGQVFKTYWITEFNNELYIMDQHAAHEKVNYEIFLKEFKERKIISQQLFPPLMITLSAAEKLAVMNNINLFKETGFEVDDFGGDEVSISAVPINLVGLEPRDIFLEFAEYLSNNLSGLTEDIFVRRLATMGCKAAVKGNQELSVSEVEELMEKLLKLDNPYTCPHGRPTIIRMTKEELDKKFRRIVE